jgi:hypothetical protein
MRHARWIVVPLIVVALVTQAPVATARKRKPKASISAVVNGRRVKFGKKLITSSGDATAGSITLGGVKSPHRLGQTGRVLQLGCAVALSANVFPADGMFCVMSYAEVKLARGVPTKTWTAVEGVQVTVTSFDGTRIAGTFSATLEPAAGTNEGPATVTDGKFDVPLNTP